MGDESFGFTKDTEAIARRNSFSESLTNALHAPGLKKANGFLQKRSSAGRYNKRWFVVHGHYLSYYRHDPTHEKKKEPLGALDLWHVEGVSLDENIITLRLSPHAFQARMDEMGGDTARKLISANPLAKGWQNESITCDEELGQLHPLRSKRQVRGKPKSGFR